MSIAVTRLKEVLHYNPETGVFTWLKRLGWKGPVGSVAGTINHWGRRMIMIDQKMYQAHRLAWLYVAGKWPENEIDHINGDPSDNRIANLREATSSQNKHNMKRVTKNSTGYKGVYFHKKANKFGAQITKDGKHHWLGLFETADEAHAAWQRAAIDLHGEFARMG